MTGAQAESSEVVRINFDHLKKDLSGFVRGTVEDALNGLLNAEAEQLCNAKRYERNEERSAVACEHVGNEPVGKLEQLVPTDKDRAQNPACLSHAPKSTTPRQRYIGRMTDGAARFRSKPLGRPPSYRLRS